MNQIDQLATTHARQAIEAGGPRPFNADGACILPTGPTFHDIAAAAEAIGRKLEQAETMQYIQKFRDEMKQARSAAYGDDEPTGTEHGEDCPICPPDEEGRPSCPVGE